MKGRYLLSLWDDVRSEDDRAEPSTEPHLVSRNRKTLQRIPVDGMYALNTFTPTTSYSSSEQKWESDRVMRIVRCNTQLVVTVVQDDKLLESNNYGYDASCFAKPVGPSTVVKIWELRQSTTNALDESSVQVPYYTGHTPHKKSTDMSKDRPPRDDIPDATKPDIVGTAASFCDVALASSPSPHQDGTQGGTADDVDARIKSIMDEYSSRMNVVLGSFTSADDVRSHSSYAQKLYAKGRFDEAIKECDIAISCDATDGRNKAHLQSIKGDIYVAKKTLGEAIAEYDQALRLSADYNTAIYLSKKAMALKDQGNVQEAWACLDLAITALADESVEHVFTAEDRKCVNNAITQERVKIAVKLITLGVELDVNAPDHNESTLILHAASMLDEQYAHTLLAHGANPFLNNEYDRSAFSVAVRASKIKLVDTFLDVFAHILDSVTQSLIDAFVQEGTLMLNAHKTGELLGCADNHLDESV